MKILYFGDPIGCGEETFEKEALNIKRTLKMHIFKSKKFDFTSTVNSLVPIESQYDVCIFDFGGIGLGCSGLVSSLSRELLSLIEERPNTLFVAWTTFTNDYLKEECQKELGDYPNLICNNDTEVCCKEIKKWINLRG